MSELHAGEAQATSRHSQWVQDHKMLARLIAEGLKHAALTHGDLFSIYRIADAMRKSNVLGIQRGFDLAKMLVEETGVFGDKATPMPTQEWLTDFAARTSTIRLRREMWSFLTEDQQPPISWFDTLLSGKLEFPYQGAAPMPPENFAKQFEAAKAVFAARRSERTVHANHLKIDLDNHFEEPTLYGDRDVSIVNKIEKEAKIAAGNCRLNLYADIENRINSNISNQLTAGASWTWINLNSEFNTWFEKLSGEFGKIILDNERKGSTSKFEMPQPEIWRLNNIHWSPPPMGVTRDDLKSGATCAGKGSLGGTSVGVTAAAYQSGIGFTSAKLLALSQAMVGGAVFGGVVGAVVGVVVWWAFRTPKAEVASAYSSHVRDKVASEIEAAAIKDFVERFEAYYSEITVVDSIMAQHSLDQCMEHAITRLQAANTTAYYELDRSRDRARPDLKIVAGA